MLVLISNFLYLRKKTNCRPFSILNYVTGCRSFRPSSKIKTTSLILFSFNAHIAILFTRTCIKGCTTLKLGKTTDKCYIFFWIFHRLSSETSTKTRRAAKILQKQATKTGGYPGHLVYTYFFISSQMKIWKTRVF